MWHQLAREAEACLPEPVWTYFSTGAREQVSVTEAAAAWAARRFRPRVLRDVTRFDPATSLLGTTYRAPVGIAPTSLQRCADPAGEVAMAQAAAAVGVPHVVSSNAGQRFAAIAGVGAPWWVQTYLTQRRDDCLRMLDAAVEAGAAAIVLTADLPFPGPKPGLAENAFDDIDLSWHRVNYGPDDEGGDWAQDLTPADVSWLRERTGLPVVVKGVLHPGDVEPCLEAGAAAVWVSNHGGRQLDRAVTTAEALPAVSSAVAGRAEVYVDGGIRSGLDALAGLAAGADAVFLGRMPLYALAAGGAERVADTLTGVVEELVQACRLGGLSSPRQAPDVCPEAL